VSWSAFAAVKAQVSAQGSPWTPTERLVALAIADHLGAAGSAWPSRRRLAQWTGLGDGSIKRALRRLCSGSSRLFDVEPGGSTPGRRIANTFKLADLGHGGPGAEGETESETGATVAPDPGPDLGHCGPGSAPTWATVAPDLGHSGPRPGPQRPTNYLRTTQGTSETEQRRRALEALPHVVAVADAYRVALGRKSATLATLEAARRGLDAGATPADLSAIAQAVGLAKRTPSLAPRGGLLAWAVEHGKLDAEYLFRPANIDKLSSEAEAVLRGAKPGPATEAPYADRPLDEVPFHARAREAARRQVAGAA
jgi:hypothetical protein